MESNSPVMLAAQAMYAAQDAIPAKPAKDASDAEWDAYCEARTAYDQAESAYDAAYRAKMTGYVGTIRKA